MPSGLDRLGGNPLAPWREAVIGWVRSDWPDLTNRQLALLMIIGRDAGPHTVRGLALRLAVPKATGATGAMSTRSQHRGRSSCCASSIATSSRRKWTRRNNDGQAPSRDYRTVLTVYKR